MNILVINLTRFGDLLQSAAALRALAGNKAENRVGVVCLENFAAGAELLPVDGVFALPTSRMLSLLNAGTPPGTRPGSGCRAEWLRGLGCLHEWAETVRTRFKPNMVCNLSSTTASSALGRLLAGDGEYTGFTLDDFGFSHNTSLWASFLQGASAARATSPFNIVDLFRKVARQESEVSDASLLPVPEDALATMRERLAAKAPEKPSGFLALQLGASADIRRWPVASFAETGDALWRRRRLFPVLLGTRAEQPLAEEYAALAREPHISLMGQTGLTELGAALTASALCISNDTGTLHLASGLNVPVLGIYLATAQPWDTGPYAPGNCSLEPDLPCHPCEFGDSCPNTRACHAAVRPETVIALAEAKLTSGVWSPANFSPSAARGARIWESSAGAYGFADLLSLSGHEKEGRTQWMRLQRHLYRQFFDKKPGAPFAATPPARAFTVNGDRRERLVAACGEIVALFDVLLQQSAMLGQNPVPLVRERFQRTWHRLAAQLKAQSEFAAVARAWQTEAFAISDLESAIPLARQYENFFSSLRAFLG